MAFVTNQWLVGSPAKTRPHDPVTVSVEVANEDDWCKRNGVVTSLLLRRTTGDYKEVHFRSDDIEIAVSQLMNAAGAALKRNLAREVLIQMSDTELLDFLSSVLTSTRVHREA